MSGVFVSALSAWAPGVESADEWQEWAAGKRKIKVCTDAPSLAGFTASLFRRRLSQLSRMTVQVVHDTVQADKAGAENLPMVFVSNRGELSRELSISKMLVSEHEVLPASFSLSVFNAPIALAAIALHLHGAYTAVYPSEGNFAAAFTAAAARVTSGRENSVLVVYADEAVPKEYESLNDAKMPSGEPLLPLAFAFVLSRTKSAAGAADWIEVKTEDTEQEASVFLRRLIMANKRCV